MFDVACKSDKSHGFIRVLFVAPYYYPELKFGGPSKRLHCLARELLTHGYNISVVTFHSEWPRRNTKEGFDGIAIQYLPWLGRFPYVVPRGLAVINALVAGADVVHLFGLYNLICPIAAWRAYASRKPYLIEPMGMFVPRVRSRFSKQLFNAAATKKMAKEASAIVATSELEARELKRCRI